MATLTLDNITKRYGGTGGDGLVAVDRLNLEIADGEFMVFVGPLGLRQVHGPSHGGRTRGHHQRRTQNRR